MRPMEAYEAMESLQIERSALKDSSPLQIITMGPDSFRITLAKNAPFSVRIWGKLNEFRIEPGMDVFLFGQWIHKRVGETNLGTIKGATIEV